MNGHIKGKPMLVQNGNNTIVFPTICFYFEEEKMHPYAMFYKANTLDFVFPVFMAKVIMAFLVSWFIYFLLRPLRQPRFVCNILAGIILGPSVLGRNQIFMEKFFPPKEMLIFNTFSKLGTAYLIFIVAIKMDTDILLKSAKKTWPIGLCSYIFPLIVTSFLGFAMKTELFSCIKHTREMIFLSGSLSVTYFPVVAQFIQELGLLTTDIGQLALSASMLIQMMSHVLTVLGVIVTRDTCLRSVCYFLIVCVTVLFAVYVIRPLILLIIERTPKGQPVKQNYVIAILVGTLVMAVVTDLTWSDFLSGAFIMGLIVPNGPPLGSTLVEKSELMVMEFFLPLFFVQVGYLVEVSSLQNINAVIAVLLLVTVCCLTKIIGTLFASLFLNIRFHNAILLGIILNFKGVVDLTSFEQSRFKNVLDAQCYTTLVLFYLLLVAIFYPLIEILYKPRVRYEENWSRSLQSTRQGSELRVLTCIYDEDNVHGMIALLETFSLKAAISPLCAYVVHVVDLISQTAPLLLPYKSRKTNRRHRRGSSSSHIMRAFVNYSKNRSTGYVTVQPFTIVAPFKTMHNIICDLAEERQIPFIIVPFHKNQKGVLQDFNSGLQLNSLCSVGIFVDRGLKPRTMNKPDTYSCRIAVLFVGGADDREALALAIRMSENPEVNITTLRINSTKDKDMINFSQELLDDLLVKEFMEKNLYNSRVVCHEVQVNDSLQMLNVIQSLRENYDLILIGKKSGARHFERDMFGWVEHQELGVIGDMITSADYYDDNTSVLVTEHCSLVTKSMSISSSGPELGSRNSSAFRNDWSIS
ncbi:cation/H(+) antiporter 15-like [Mercurialis annua]|uniref:cation/H(+) antiporter 15-like n=1 Tax=Mercurialis annua TaxID=3986 RepID=UPI0024AE048B|nr:cation/H(+) antiporter 15-like [Mercurialis annua]